MATDGRIEFRFGFGREPARRGRPEPDAPFRILVCADLSGSAATPRPPLADRRPLRVDVDNIDRVLARVAPRLALELPDGEATIALERIEDFHPDRLVRRIPAFASLRRLRDDLDDPARFEDAATAMGAGLQRETRGSAPASRPAAAQMQSDLERLLGARSRVAPAPPAAATQAGLDRWIRELVAPHVVADHGERKQMLVASVDAALAGLMRKVLRDDSLRRLECAWLGVDRLVRELGGEENLEIHLLDVTPEELLRDAQANADDLSRSASWRQIAGTQARGASGAGWSVVVVDRAFDASADDVALLAALAAAASHANAPLLAEAAPSLLGCARADTLGEPASWAPLDDGSARRWRALRGLDAAAWVALALPRVLMRQPYGGKSDPIETFAFEEIVDPADGESFVWGNPAFALARLAGAAFRDEGWTMDLEARLDVADLPAFSYRHDGETRLRVCAQALVSEAAGERLLRHGLMPLLGRRDLNALRVLRWQSIAEPAQRLRGPWL